MPEDRGGRASKVSNDEQSSTSQATKRVKIFIRLELFDLRLECSSTFLIQPQHTLKLYQL